MSSLRYSGISSVSLNLLILAATLLVSPTLSTSRHASLHHPHAIDTGFRVPLRRVDSGKTFTKFELLRRAMGREKQRIEQLQAMVVSASDHHANDFESPIHAGEGEFLMELSIGTPPVSFSAILDTGSDLVWTQCLPCKRCFPQTTQIFDSEKSSSFTYLPCSSELCSALPSSSCDDGQSCQYTYLYGDYSSTKGVMGVETFTFDNVSVPKIGFGCGFVNDGSGFDQGAGLVGLGRGDLSLISQLNVTKFSYCLASFDSNKPGMLQIGSLGKELTMEPLNKATPLIKNPSSPTFYYLSLQGITVGHTRLNIEKSNFQIQEDGTGGMIIDTGTTITYLPRNAYYLVKNAFVSQMKLPVDKSPYGKVFDLCFILPTSNGTSSIDIEVPRMVFHFEGVDLELPEKNYFVADTSGVACLAMGSSNGISIFGNFQQQDLLVVHDLVKETVGFVPTKCDQASDNKYH
ncbi:aspartic proteinase nepenthesin-1-like [Primulina tabacum]|uniref:aspartic proteinase nepenthesin-1-like n=1 Tax=Primulina tabacum TaxID=48773 RepID=UPI003F5A4913